MLCAKNTLFDAKSIEVNISGWAASAANPKDIGFGSDGFLYVNDDDIGSKSVLKIDPTSGAVNVFTDRTALEALPEIPQLDTLNGGIVGAPNGIIYTAGRTTLGPGGGVIFALAPDGTPSVLAQGDPLDNLEAGLTRDASGDLLVADGFDDDEIIRISPDGQVSVFVSHDQLVDVAGSDDLVDLEGGIAFDSKENFFVTLEDLDGIIRFNPSLNGIIFVSEANITAVTNELSADPEGGIAFSEMETMPGDLNGDGCADREDYNIVIADIRGHRPFDPVHDLNEDGVVNRADARTLVGVFTNLRGAPCE